MRLLSPLLLLVTVVAPASPPATEEAPKKANPVAIVALDGEVNEESVTELMGNMLEARNHEAKAILLEINSPGGSVYAGMKLAKVIEMFGLSGTPVTCVVDGVAASMAFYILQACQARIMTDRSILMAHEPSMSPGSAKADDLKTGSDVLVKLGHAMAHHEARRMKVTVEQFEERIKGKDWYMTDDDATEVGAVDKVATSVNEVYEEMIAPTSSALP